MARYIAVLHNQETDEPVTTVVIEAENDAEAFAKADAAAAEQGYYLGDLILGA